MFVAVTGGVVVPSLLPVPGGGPERFLLGVGLDKWAHGVGYAAVSLAFAWARGHQIGSASADATPTVTGTSARVVLAAIVVGVGVGAGAELLQAPLATRTASLADAGANAVGAVLGSAAWLVARR